LPTEPKQATRSPTLTLTGLRVDKKAATLSIASPADGASYNQKQPVTASFGCFDGGPGVASCTGAAANGTNIDTATPGTKSFTVTATDGVGHAASQTVTYTVIAAPAYQMCALYDQSSEYKSGNTLPIKLQLCDANGNNLSSTAITVTAISVSAPAILADAGGANPGKPVPFRSDARYHGATSTT
jgi:hypothetical protein